MVNKKKSPKKAQTQKPVQNNSAGLALSLIAILIGTVIALNRFEYVLSIAQTGMIALSGIIGGIVISASGSKQ
jgi:hypothetical protein